MRFLAILTERFLHDVRDRVLAGARFDETVAEIADRRLDPYSAAERVLGGGSLP
jgi:hypothetical protein